MSIVRNIGSGIVWNTSGNVAGKIVGLANVFLVLTHLSVYEYGLIELTLSIVSTIGLFLLPGLSATLTADLGVERARGNIGQMKALFHEYLGFSFVTGVLAWAVLFFGSTIIASVTDNILVDRFFKIVSFLFLTAPLRNVSTMLATVFIRYVDQSFYSVVEEGIKAVALLVMFFVFQRGADGVLYAMLIAQISTLLVFLPRTLSAYKFFSEADVEQVQSMWTILREHRKWSVASTYAGTLSNNVYLWIIKFFLGTEAVGVYAFTVGVLANIAGLLPLGPVIAPLIPKYVDSRDRLTRLMKSAIKVQMSVAVVYIIGSLIALPAFVFFLFPKYIPALPLLMIIVFSLIPQSIISILSPTFIALKEQRSQFGGVLFKMAVSIVLLPFALMLWGVAGASVVAVVALFASAAERSIRVTRMIGNIIPTKRDLTTLDPMEREFALYILRKIGLNRTS